MHTLNATLSTSTTQDHIPPFLSPLRSIPGPFLARLTRLWELRQTVGGKLHETLVKLHEKYGPVVRVSPNLYSFSSPEDQRKICAINSGFTKTSYYDAYADPGQPNLFSVRDEADHTERRKKLGSLYSMNTMVNYEPAVDRMNAVVMQKLAGFANTRGKLIQIPLFRQYYAFDVIGEITLNKALGFMTAESDVDDLIKTMHEGTVNQSTLGVMPEFHPLPHADGPLLGFKNEGTELVYNSTEQLNKHRKALKFGEEKSKTNPSITKLLKPEAAGKVNVGNMIDLIISNIAAGSDTTAITISAALYHLYRNPKILAKLREEIDTMTREGNVSDPVSFKEAQSMP